MKVSFLKSENRSASKIYCYALYFLLSLPFFIMWIINDKETYLLSVGPSFVPIIIKQYLKLDPKISGWHIYRKIIVSSLKITTYKKSPKFGKSLKTTFQKSSCSKSILQSTGRNICVTVCVSVHDFLQSI